MALDKATEYAAEDTDVTLRLWQVLKPRLPAEHMNAVYETLERPMTAVLGRMERRGIRIDRAILARLSGEFAGDAARLEAQIHEMAGGPFNIGSPKQLADILFGTMGLPGARKTATGAWSTAANILEDLAEQGNPFAGLVLEWRQTTKLKNNYCDALPTYADAQDRVHTSYMLASTTTGRLSSTEPNLQNIPVRNEAGRKIRTAFVAAPGHVLMSADYSQIELRLLAHIADIPQLKEAFAAGHDIHAMTASEMFSVPLEAMTPDIRRRAKAINLRHHLRHLGFRARQPARHRPRRGGRLHQDLFRALPRHPRLHGRDKGLLPHQGLCRDPVRSALPLPAHHRLQPVRARLQRARGNQRAYPGHGGRHHPPRDDPHGWGPGARGPRRQDAAAGARTNWCSRCRKPRWRKPRRWCAG